MSSTVKCPSCNYKVQGGLAPNNCCAGCALMPGKHGLMCKKVQHPVGQCHSCDHATTGLANNHCCKACEKTGGHHGPLCKKQIFQVAPVHVQVRPTGPVWVPKAGGDHVAPHDGGVLAQTPKGTYYVGRVAGSGGVFPGKVEPGHKVCYYGVAGRVEKSANYECLQCKGARWQPFAGAVPPNAIAGGTAPDGTTLYIGNHDGVIGKIKGAQCYTTWGDKEEAHTSFDVLVL